MSVIKTRFSHLVFRDFLQHQGFPSICAADLAAVLVMLVIYSDIRM